MAQKATFTTNMHHESIVQLETTFFVTEIEKDSFTITWNRLNENSREFVAGDSIPLAWSMAENTGVIYAIMQKGPDEDQIDLFTHLQDAADALADHMNIYQWDFGTHERNADQGELFAKAADEFEKGPIGSVVHVPSIDAEYGDMTTVTLAPVLVMRGDTISA
jgi:hypothetical protein